MKALSKLCLALAFSASFVYTSHADDIDIYSGNANTLGVPNVLFVIDTGANFSSSASVPCTAYSAAAGGGAPSLGNTAGGIEQCALVDAIAGLADGTVNIGIMVNNRQTFGTDNRALTDPAYHENCGGIEDYGGCVVRKLTLMDTAGKAGLINFIKSWKTSGSNSATEFNVKSGGDRTANMMQEAWAYYNGKLGMSGKNYGTSLLGTGCQRNFIVFIGNSFNNSGGPADGGSVSPNNSSTGLTSAQVGATTAQRTKISDTVTFDINPTCGVASLAASTNSSNWSENWADEWARLMRQQDGSSTLTGNQNITTYTIGVVDNSASNTCKPDYPALLDRMAHYGGGEYFQTSNATDLKLALDTILNEVQAVDSVFSSASLPVSVNAQGTYLNQVFLGMFRPDASASPRWVGNLKQYQFRIVGDARTGDLELADSANNSAISNDGSGFISPNAISFWTTKNQADNAMSGGFFNNDPLRSSSRDGYDSPDGELVERGGSAQRIRVENLTSTFSGAMNTSTNPRRLYTYCSADSVCAPGSPSTSLTAAVNEFSTGNANILAAHFGDSVSVKINQITRSGTVATATTSGAHGFASGSTVTISNSPESSYNGTKTIASVPSTTTFTFAADNKPTTPSLGAYVFSTVGGSPVSVTSMSRSTSTGAGINSETVTVLTTGHAFTAGQVVTIAGATPSSYNGNWTIALPNAGGCLIANCFTFSTPIYPKASAASFSAVVAPASIGVSTITKTGNSGSGGTGNVATVTTSAAHGLHQGQYVNITSTEDSKLTVTNVQVVAVLSSTSFTYQGYANGAKSPAAGGSVTPATAAQTVSLSRASTAATVTVTATGAASNAFGRVAGDTKVLNISKTGAAADETGYVASNVTVTCTNTGCTSFTYSVATSPAVSATGTITASNVSAGSVTINAGGITRVGSVATVTGATANLFGSAVGATNTVNVSTSGTSYPDEAAYLGSGTLTITCQTANCSTFTYGVTESPLTSVSGSNIQAFQSGSAPDRDTLMRWVRGENNFGDEFTPDASVKVRPSVHGDVLHSRPVVINYGDRSAINGASSGLVVFYGANDGVFRAVNGNKTTGNIGGVAPGGEIWGLVLPEHFGQLNRLRLNSPELKLPATQLATAQPKPYFVDGSPGVYQLLKSDGTIDKAIIYLTMRRGGRFIYAIDVSEPTTPVVLWKKSYTDTGFEEMGQTWSRPRLTLVKGYKDGVTGKGKPVLVFGAGYDPAEDSEPPATGTMGRGMYVIDAITGDLLWSATHTSAGTTSCSGTGPYTCAVSGMNWAIPADIAFLDRDNDGYTDRFYAADVGGNVWRVDLEPGVTPTAAIGTWQVTKLAALGCDTGTCASGTNPRKFFFPPSVLMIGATPSGLAASSSGVYDLLALSSGDREHPLESSQANSVSNNFFVVKDFSVDKDARRTGAVGETPTDPTVITKATLFNGGGVDDGNGNLALNPYNAAAAASNPSGFYIALASGEKGVNAPVTTRGTTFFGTNKPIPVVSGQLTCSANLGEARGYSISPFTGALDFTEFEGGGLPPTPTTGVVSIDVTTTTNGVTTTTTVKRDFCVGCGGGGGAGGGGSGGGDDTSSLGAGELTITVPKRPRRTYWYRN